MPSPQRIYWDSCVFLSYVNEDEGRVGDISSLLEGARKQEIELVTSTVSIVEVAFGAAERKQSALSEEMEAKINKLWEAASPVTMVEFHVLIAEAAKRMMRSGIPEGWSLKPMDAVHLATAQRLGVDELHTYDDPLKKWATKVSYPIIEPSHASTRLL
ncbi:MAG: type II toxin-antitoxin system VapC family toxin [Solirubrobacterales bacterium]|nr:type II toxin-antitoxin system VapC family toxin [Solirubrobacterales bacterium]